MSDKISEAITALREREPTDYRKARAAHHAAIAEYNAQSKMIARLGERPYRTLERAMARALKPHRVEWKRYGQPSENRHGAADVNHADWVTDVHLAGEVWPDPKGGKYTMRMRVHLPFSITPRDAEEFRRGVALLKAAADAVRDGGI